MKIKYLALPVLILATACATHRDVRPGADGINRVIVRAPTRERAEQEAIAEANDYCDTLNKHPGFINESSQYKGTMDEGTRETLQKASMAAMVLGGGTGVLAHDPGVRTGGTVLGAAGTAGTIMTNGNDYVADMKFQCQ